MQRGGTLTHSARFVLKRIVQSPSDENDCADEALAAPAHTHTHYSTTSAFRKLEPAAGAAALVAPKVTISADGAECWVN